MKMRISAAISYGRFSAAVSDRRFSAAVSDGGLPEWGLRLRGGLYSGVFLSGHAKESPLRLFLFRPLG